jgi:uncharacterized protein YvpB
MEIKHDIPLKTQSSSSNCVQTSTSQFLSFYKIDESADNIEAAVPVRVSSEGKPMGTLFADIGTWLKKTQNVLATMHVFDTQIIDRSWGSLSQQELLAEVKIMQKHGVATAKTPYAPLLIDAYASFLESGGTISISKCTNTLLQSLLSKGPILAIISFNYMYDYPRASYNPDIKNYEANSIDGKAIEHAIVITGYSDGNYYYNDPDSEKGGKHTVKDDILIGAICTAQLNSDNYLMTIEK